MKDEVKSGEWMIKESQVNEWKIKEKLGKWMTRKARWMHDKGKSGEWMIKES